MPKESYKPYQVPNELWTKLEAEAVEKRKETGENVTWSKLLKEIIIKHFEK